MYHIDRSVTTNCSIFDIWHESPLASSLKNCALTRSGDLSCSLCITGTLVCKARVFAKPNVLRCGTKPVLKVGNQPRKSLGNHVEWGQGWHVACGA